MNLPAKKEEATMLPSVALNVNLPEQTNPIVEAQQIVGIYQEILEDIRKDRDEIENAYTNFAEMVFNAGDATAASKEALVNLLKLKSDSADKKSKVMDTLMRAFLSGAPKQVNATQHNDFRIEDNSKRQLIDDISSGKIKRLKDEQSK